MDYINQIKTDMTKSTKCRSSMTEKQNQTKKAFKFIKKNLPEMKEEKSIVFINQGQRIYYSGI